MVILKQGKEPYTCKEQMLLQGFRVSLLARFEVLTAVLMALPRPLRCKRPHTL
jgi:hypothetical protein